MNILLTGGTGYIGSHTAVALIEAGHRVVLLDNLSNSRRDVVSQLENITQQNIPFVEGDVRDTPLVSRTIQDYQVDTVVHFAGLKAVGKSVSEPLRYFDNNVGGTISLLNAMQQRGIKKILFSSSATVYGEPQYLPIDESHPTKAVNPYGRSKLHIEEILKDLSLSDPEWSVICLRYFNPVGAHASGLIGENPNGAPNNLMPYLLDVAYGKLPALSVFGDDYETPDGTGVRDYIHVMDLAEGHLAALNAIEHRSGWEVFNLGTGIGTSVFEMISTLERQTGKRIAYQISERREGDVAICYAKVDKAKVNLNWEATRTIDSMCISSFNFKRGF